MVGPVRVMKRLLLCLCLVGTVFPGHTPLLLQTQSRPPTAEQSIGARPGSTIPSLATLTPMSGPELQHSGVERVAVRAQDMQSITDPLAVAKIEHPSVSLPSTEETHESSRPPVTEGKGEEAIWVVVIRGATVHSGPSVSAPTVRFYRVGTELNLIGYQQGWFQVSDPSQQGWIYEKYYLQAISGPGRTPATVQNSPSPTRAAFKAPKPRPPLRRVKKPRPRQDQQIQSRIANARIQNEGVASLVEKAFRGY
jgi:hypothetical protein